jgi:hypothetical protein
MDFSTADNSAIFGYASPSDYDLLTGGSYSTAQDPYTAVDNGTVNNSTTGTGTASTQGTATPPAGGASYTPPSWLSSITGLASSVGSAVNSGYTSILPIIGGKPAAGPAQAGQVPATGTAKTVSVGGSSFSMTTLLLVIAGIAAAFFFFKKK